MASSLLTDTKIRGLKPKQSAYYAWQASSSRGTGRLGVKVYPSGRKTFIYRYFINGKASFITLGDYPALCLSDASSRCKEEAQKLQQGQPIISPYASLKMLFKNYITDQRLRGKRSYEKTNNRLKQVLGSQHINGDTPARDITPEHIKKYYLNLLKEALWLAQIRFALIYMPFLILGYFLITIRLSWEEKYCTE